MHGQSECSEQTTSSEGTRPVVLEEFIPIKRTHSSSDNHVIDNENDDGDDNDQEHHSHKRINKEEKNSDHKKKSDWLRSVQLWNQSPDLPLKEDVPRKAAVTEVKRNEGAFQPFHKERTIGKSNKITAKVPASAASSTAGTGSGGSTSGGGGSSKKEERKQRRCWSPELHKRFLHALQQLGGSHAATPKQIRELMKVDGLTNDEVKSHLQKFRLHTRRPNHAMHTNNNPQAPQFVVVGGIWVPPPEYAAAATTASGETATIAAANRIYAPVAAPPPATVAKSAQKQQQQQQTESENLQSEGRDSHSEGRIRSNSPATSSSTHTTTNSPVF